MYLSIKNTYVNLCVYILDSISWPIDTHNNQFFGYQNTFFGLAACILQSNL